MSAQHTPGPWEFDPIEHAARIPFGPSMSVIAYGKTDANARLIAAAPAMFEALKAWVALAEGAMEQYGVQPHLSELAVLNGARAALQLAQGNTENSKDHSSPSSPLSEER